MVRINGAANVHEQPTIHYPLPTIHCPLSSFRMTPGCATLRRVKRVDRLHPAPRIPAHTHKLECLSSAPGRRFATPLPHNPRGQRELSLPPWRRLIGVRTRPSHRPAGGGSPASPPPVRSSPHRDPESSCRGRLLHPD